jgi:hypothetical protein
VYYPPYYYSPSAAPAPSATPAPVAVEVIETAPQASLLDKTITTGYASGYPDSTVRPDSPITRYETASLIFQLIDAAKKGQGSASFRDVPDGQWYTSPVAALTSLGVLHGYENGEFRGSLQITRAEFAAIIAQVEGLEPVAESGFLDVPASSWAAPWIGAARSKGYISGYGNGLYKPNDPITRAEAFSIVNRVLGIEPKPNATNPFSDISSKHWAYGIVLAAAK